MLLKIGSCDCSAMITKEKYLMQEGWVYEEWTDGNGKRHRVTIARRITGSVTLKPRSESEYNALISALTTEQKDSGGYKVNAFINNLNKNEIFDAFIEGNFLMHSNTGRKWWKYIDLTIEEE